MFDIANLFSCITQFRYGNCVRKPRDSRVVQERLTDELK